MAKARSRLAARKIKDKWKAKAWYKVQAPVNFGHAEIAETLADEPQKLVGRLAETTLQDLTGDFKQMHVKLAFRIRDIEGNTAKTTFDGHSLTSDYVRRMTRRNHSKIDGVIDVTTRDGAKVRVKPLGVSDKRTKTTQEAAVRSIMLKELETIAADLTLNRFVREVVDGKVSARLFKAVKTVYPLRRVEINKTQVLRLPQVELEEDWSEPEPEPAPETTEDTGDDEATETEADDTEGSGTAAQDIDEEETSDVAAESIEEAAEETPEGDAEDQSEAETDTETEEPVTAEAKE